MLFKVGQFIGSLYQISNVNYERKNCYAFLTEKITFKQCIMNIIIDGKIVSRII